MAVIITIPVDMTLEEFIIHLYDTMLGRDPEEGAVKIWADVTRRGKSHQPLINNIINSPEFVVKHPTLLADITGRKGEVS